MAKKQQHLINRLSSEQNQMILRAAAAGRFSGLPLMNGYRTTEELQLLILMADDWHKEVMERSDNFWRDFMEFFAHAISVVNYIVRVPASLNLYREIEQDGAMIPMFPFDREYLSELAAYRTLITSHLMQYEVTPEEAGVDWLFKLNTGLMQGIQLIIEGKDDKGEYLRQVAMDYFKETGANPPDFARSANFGKPSAPAESTVKTVQKMHRFVLAGNTIEVAAEMTIEYYRQIKAVSKLDYKIKKTLGLDPDDNKPPADPISNLVRNYHRYKSADWLAG